MRFILISVAAVVAAASLFAPVQASAADVFERLTSAKLSAILTARGGKNVEVTKPEAGTEVVSMGDESGTQNFVMSNCTAQGCEVLSAAAPKTVAAIEELMKRP